MSDYRLIGSLLLLLSVERRLSPDRIRRVDSAKGLGDTSIMSLTPEQRSALAEIGRMGGKRKSAAKTAAAQRNGKSGAAKQRRTLLQKKQLPPLTSQPISI